MMTKDYSGVGIERKAVASPSRSLLVGALSQRMTKS